MVLGLCATSSCTAAGLVSFRLSTGAQSAMHTSSMGSEVVGGSCRTRTLVSVFHLGAGWI